MSMAGDIRIAAMGDVMLDRAVGEHFRRRPEDFDMADIRALLAPCDLVLANLETTVSTRGTPDPRQDPHVAFRSHPDTLRVLKNLGVDAVSLANNHLLDWGAEALADTLANLDAAGIAHAGAGRDYEEANRPLLLERAGLPLALLSHVFIYSASTRRATRRRAGVADHRIGRILKRIRRLRREGRIVIVTLHWGMEYSFYPLPYQARQARRMIDAGASLVLGHGPHYPQGIERHGHGRIVYSTGNFIFDEPYRYARRSFIYTAALDAGGRVVEDEVHPVLLPDHVPHLAQGEAAARLRRQIHCLGAGYGRKSRRFWKRINSEYFTDIAGRVVRMRSPKFLFLPPLSFYLDIGLGNLLRKLRLRTVLNLVRGAVR